MTSTSRPDHPTSTSTVSTPKPQPQPKRVDGNYLSLVDDEIDLSLEDEHDDRALVERRFLAAAKALEGTSDARTTAINGTVYPGVGDAEDANEYDSGDNDGEAGEGGERKGERDDASSEEEFVDQSDRRKPASETAGGNGSDKSATATTQPMISATGSADLPLRVLTPGIAGAPASAGSRASNRSSSATLRFGIGGRYLSSCLITYPDPLSTHP